MADIREQLLAAFELEYREHVDAIRQALAVARGGQTPNLREIFRRAHSLKGAARAVGLPAVEDASHAMEAELAGAMDAGALDGGRIERISNRLDEVERLAAALYRARGASGGPGSDAQDSSPTEYLRINAAQIQRLSAAMYELSTHLDFLDREAEALQDVQARAEALSRLMERSGDRSGDSAGRVAQEARAVVRGLAAVIRRQKDAVHASMAAADRLGEEVERVALVPASTVFAGLDAMLRDMAAEAGRQVDIQLTGLDTQADRLLLQSLRDPVIHLLRNAVAHGVEPPAERSAANKPETGVVGLSVRARAGRLELTVYDDGRGPDLKRIEDVAIRRGLLPPRSQQDGSLSSDRLLALAFEPGFSTSEGVDRVSGRGMGLSVVAETARRAGGGAFMRRRSPWGTEVTISTPLSAARQTMLLAEDGGQSYGFPTRAIERVVHVAGAEFELLDGRRVLKIQVDGNQIACPVVPLGQALGAGRAAGEESGLLNIAVLRQGDQRLGVHVDSFADVRTGTVSALAHPDVDDLVQGVMQMEQDHVAIVLNPEALMRRYLQDELSLRSSTVAPVRKAARQRTILVVDDSVTTRTLEKSILESNGYKVLLAVDGVDALERLRAAAAPVDLIVADVEMPRMDGFQLLSALKADSQLAATPVVMMTSRASPDDIRRGMELGADAYLVKQTFDQRELLDVVRQLL